MEISCPKCSTAFVVDDGAASAGSLEAVCPGCFTLHSVPLGEKPARPPQDSAARDLSGSAFLGESSIADRLRDGFSLYLEVRGPSMPNPQKLNYFQLKRLIYSKDIRGDEEFRQGQGRWFPIGDHPELARVFLIAGNPIAASRESVENARQIVGWNTVGRRALPVTAFAQAQTQHPSVVPADVALEGSGERTGPRASNIVPPGATPAGAAQKVTTPSPSTVDSATPSTPRRPSTAWLVGIALIVLSIVAIVIAQMIGAP